MKDLCFLNRCIKGRLLAALIAAVFCSQASWAAESLPSLTADQVPQSVEELYIRLAAGVGGTGMPAWKGTIEDDEIWAAAYYVRSLMDLKNTPARSELMGRLK